MRSGVGDREEKDDSGRAQLRKISQERSRKISRKISLFQQKNKL